MPRLHFILTLTALAIALLAYRRAGRAHRRITIMAKQVDEQLARIDAYTNELAEDLDRLAGKVETFDADTAAALKARADALRLVADKSQPDPVPAPPEPIA